MLGDGSTSNSIFAVIAVNSVRISKWCWVLGVMLVLEYMGL